MTTNDLSSLHPRLSRFVEDCLSAIDAGAAPAAQVDAIAPLMLDLLAGDRHFLSDANRTPNPDHYARNPIYFANRGVMSLFALVWLPGQWTPVHDHGTWGVVGIVEGVLEERSFMTQGHQITSDAGIELHRGGVVLLTDGAVTSFVPNPDHIHETGVPAKRKMAVSLHLYGRELNDYHAYDVERGTRKMINIPQYRS
jgi:3-mercaptopropionate dioxygenase